MQHIPPGWPVWVQESLEDQHRLHTQLPDSHRAPSATALFQHQQQGSSTAQGPSLAPHLSEGTLALLRSFKRSLCLNSLLEMGFPAAAAQAAADRAGAELEAAVAFVMDGGGGGAAAPKQIDVSRCGWCVASQASVGWEAAIDVSIAWVGAQQGLQRLKLCCLPARTQWALQHLILTSTSSACCRAGRWASLPVWRLP